MADDKKELSEEELRTVLTKLVQATHSNGATEEDKKAILSTVKAVEDFIESTDRNLQKLKKILEKDLPVLKSLVSGLPL